MASPEKYVQVMGVVLVVVIMFAPLVSVVDSSSGIQEVTNETVTADYDDPIDLDGRDIQDGTYTVYDSDGNETTEGTDYEIDQETGELTILEGGGISDGEQLTVDYEWAATTGTTTLIVALIPLLAAVLIVGYLGIQIRDAL